MRNVRSFILLALVAALALGGTVLAQDEVTLDLWGWSSSTEENDALQAQVDAFMEANPGVTVNLNLSPEFDTQIQTAFASGDYPDVFYVDSSRLPTWVDAGVLALAGENIADLDDIPASLQEVFTLDGQLYCPPKDFSIMTLQYNKAMFDAAGLDYPTADWTWDDLRSAAAALTTTNAEGQQVIGLVTPPNLERWLPFLYQAGGTLFDEEGKVALNTPEAQEALEFYVGMVEEGIAGPQSAVDAGWGGEAFGQGRAAMAMEGNWVINYLLQQFPDLEWGAVPLPAGPVGEATMVFTVCYGVGANTPHPEEAWALVNFLTGVEGAEAVAATSFGVAPGRESAAQTWVDRFGEEMAPFVAGVDVAHRWQLPPGFTEFADAFNEGLQQAFAGQALPEDVLTTAQEVGEEIAARES